MGSTFEHHRHDEKENKEVRGKRKTGRRQWCRGKVGIEHEFTTGILKNHPGYRQTHCDYRDGWSRKTRQIVPKAYWHCIESEFCKNCGKIKRVDLGKDCPDYPGEVPATFMDYVRSK